MKKIILVIIISILIGLGIVYFTSAPTSTQSAVTSKQIDQKTTPPTPMPPLPTLDVNSNLQDELEKTTPPSFSEDIENLSL